MADTAANPSVHVPSTLEQRKYDEAVEAGAAPSEATELSRATPAPGSSWHESQGEAPDMEAASARADSAARVVGVEETTPVAATPAPASRTSRTSTRTGTKTTAKTATGTKTGTTRKAATTKKR